MAIYTTFNIKRDLKERLEGASECLNISVSKIVGLLICKIMKDRKYKSNIFSTVRYQDRDKPENWECAHISFDPKVYEIATDLKKVFKLSVSFFIALAIKKYLDLIIKELTEDKNNLDNYSYHYEFKMTYYENLLNFTVCHYKPPIKAVS